MPNPAGKMQTYAGICRTFAKIGNNMETKKNRTCFSKVFDEHEPEQSLFNENWFKIKNCMENRLKLTVYF